MSATVLVGLAVTSHNTGMAANATFTNVNVSGAAPMPPPLPDGWTATAIGPPAMPASAEYESGTYTVHAAGADVWGAADEFMFVHRPLTGDGTIVARVTDLRNTHAGRRPES